LSGVLLTTRKWGKDRDVLTSPTLLNDDAGPLGHLAQEDWEVSFEFGNSDGFHGNKFGGTEQVVKLSKTEAGSRQDGQEMRFRFKGRTINAGPDQMKLL
jgi:hypothetical protein